MTNFIVGITLFIIALIAGYIGYKKAEALELKNKKTVAVIVLFIVVILMSILSISELTNYIDTFLKQNPNLSEVGLLFLMIITAIYIELILITDDLIKNIHILISLFKI